MSATIEIQGFQEARQVLEALPDKMQAQVIRRIFTKASRPLIQDARGRLLSYNPAYRKLADAIGSIPISSKAPIVIIGVRAKGKYKDVGFIGHWVEYGVSGIKNKTSRTLTKAGDESYRFWVASVQKGGRYRRDIPPQPYMRPAIDGRTPGIQKEVADSFAKHLYNETEKMVRKTMSAKAYAIAKGR